MICYLHGFALGVGFAVLVLVGTAPRPAPPAPPAPGWYHADQIQHYT